MDKKTVDFSQITRKQLEAFATKHETPFVDACILLEKLDLLNSVAEIESAVKLVDPHSDAGEQLSLRLIQLLAERKNQQAPAAKAQALEEKKRARADARKAQKDLEKKMALRRVIRKARSFAQLEKHYAQAQFIGDRTLVRLAVTRLIAAMRNSTATEQQVQTLLSIAGYQAQYGDIKDVMHNALVVAIERVSTVTGMLLVLRSCPYNSATEMSAVKKLEDICAKEQHIELGQCRDLHLNVGKWSAIAAWNLFQQWEAASELAIEGANAIREIDFIARALSPGKACFLAEKKCREITTQRIDSAKTIAEISDILKHAPIRSEVRFHAIQKFEALFADSLAKVHDRKSAKALLGQLPSARSDGKRAAVVKQWIAVCNTTASLRASFDEIAQEDSALAKELTRKWASLCGTSVEAERMWSRVRTYGALCGKFNVLERRIALSDDSRILKDAAACCRYDDTDSLKKQAILKLAQIELAAKPKSAKK